MKVKLITRGWSRTVKKPLVISGKAPFSGKDVQLIISPSMKNDLLIEYLGHIVPVSPSSIKLQPRQHTSIIHSHGIEIMAVEHLLSALYGLGIDSAHILLEGDNQIPALDSSSAIFTHLLSKNDFQNIKQRCKVLKIAKKFIFDNGTSDSYAELSPATGFNIDLEIAFDNIIGKQKFKGQITEKSYLNELCWGRTFLRSPLINGDPTKWERIRKLMPLLPKNPAHSPILVFSDAEFITQPIQKDEPARHKVLDLLGDLALLGKRIEGKIKIYKPGHYFNQQLVQFLDSLTYERT